MKKAVLSFMMFVVLFSGIMQPISVSAIKLEEDSVYDMSKKKTVETKALEETEEYFKKESLKVNMDEFNTKYYQILENINNRKKQLRYESGVLI